MQTIGGVSRDKLLSVAEEVVERFVKFPEIVRSGRHGGYFTVMDALFYERYFIVEIGHLLPQKYFQYCEEKSTRLYEEYKLRGEISAWQSRNIGRHKYGGAIIASKDSAGIEAGRNLVGAFSGFTEHGDEAILLVIWLIFRWMTLEDAKKITAISDNKLLEPLLNVCGDLFDR